MTVTSEVYRTTIATRGWQGPRGIIPEFRAEDGTVLPAVTLLAVVWLDSTGREPTWIALAVGKSFASHGPSAAQAILGLQDCLLVSVEFDLKHGREALSVTPDQPGPNARAIAEHLPIAQEWQWPTK